MGCSWRRFRTAGLGTPVHLYHDYPTRKDALRQFVNVSLGGIQDSSTEFTYDGNGQMLSLRQTGPGLGRPIADKYVSFSYTPSGQFGSISRYEAQWADPTKLVAQSQYAYDGRNQLTGLVHAQSSSNILAQYTWTYDALGRITNQTSRDGTAEYGYDQTGQLTSAKYNAVSSSNLADQTFQYDANGNWDSSGHTTGSNNQPDSDGTFTYDYDGEGNRVRRTKIADGTWTEYAWDNRNRLIAVIEHAVDNAVPSSVSYGYDYLNRLVTRTETVGNAAPVTQHFAYDGDQIILQLDSAGQVEHRYLWGPAVDQLLADESVSDALHWTLGDQLNSVRDVVSRDATSGNASVVDHIIYEAFGKEASSSNPANDPLFRFTGRFFDPATGLQNNLNRWYDPGLHQWLSVDPILFEAGDSNPRRYVGNDPVNNRDPDGLVDIPISAIDGKDQYRHNFLTSMFDSISESLSKTKNLSAADRKAFMDAFRDFVSNSMVDAKNGGQRWAFNVHHRYSAQDSVAQLMWDTAPRGTSFFQKKVTVHSPENLAIVPFHVHDKISNEQDKFWMKWGEDLKIPDKDLGNIDKTVAAARKVGKEGSLATDFRKLVKELDKTYGGFYIKSTASVQDVAQALKNASTAGKLLDDVDELKKFQGAIADVKGRLKPGKVFAFLLDGMKVLTVTLLLSKIATAQDNDNFKEFTKAYKNGLDAKYRSGRGDMSQMQMLEINHRLDLFLKDLDIDDTARYVIDVRMKAEASTKP